MQIISLHRRDKNANTEGIKCRDHVPYFPTLLCYVSKRPEYFHKNVTGKWFPITETNWLQTNNSVSTAKIYQVFYFHTIKQCFY